MPRSLITGITGQNGAYLAERLLAKGHEVHGLKRRSSGFNTNRIDHLYQDPHLAGTKLSLHYGDMTDATNLIRVVQEVQPDEIYNLAAQSHVKVSFEIPEHTANADGLGTLRLLEAIRILVEVDPRCFRPLEVHHLLGDPNKARERLGRRHWVGFADLVEEMVTSDIEQVRRERGYGRLTLDAAE